MSQQGDIRAWLKLLDSGAKGITRGKFQSGHYSPAGMLLDFGSEMRVSKEIPPLCGELKECFANAQSLASLFDDKYRYAEGWAVLGHTPMPLLHAWCLNARGLVVDPTWCGRGKAWYFGVEIDTDYMRKRMLQTMVHHSVLDDWEYGYKLLTTPGLAEQVLVQRKKGSRT